MGGTLEVIHGRVPMSDIRRPDPIFIHGIMPRSGTNYLWQLLLQHPGCAPGRDPIREDFFLECSDHLASFVADASGHWDPMWGSVDDPTLGDLLRSLGDGLVSYLWVDPERRLVAKTPSVARLDRFFSLFPEARLIVLVRDGRSVAQSCMSTFGWDLERAARNWARAADTIERFESAAALPADRYVRIRYEDLLDDLDVSVARVLSVCGLDPERYDLEAARALPVRGSSSYFGAEHRSVHWDPVPKGPDFEPRRRWSSWTEAMHERFGWIAGAQMRRLGYDSDLRPPIRDAAERSRQRLLDWRWTTRSAMRSLTFRARVRVGSATRPVRERLGLARPLP
jgi:protein-tyrosine sulfotransferase